MAVRQFVTKLAQSLSPVHDSSPANHATTPDELLVIPPPMPVAPDDAPLVSAPPEDEALAVTAVVDDVLSIVLPMPLVDDVPLAPLASTPPAPPVPAFWNPKFPQAPGARRQQHQEHSLCEFH